MHAEHIVIGIGSIALGNPWGYTLNLNLNNSSVLLLHVSVFKNLDLIAELEKKEK